MSLSLTIHLLVFNRDDELQKFLDLLSHVVVHKSDICWDLSDIEEMVKEALVAS